MEIKKATWFLGALASCLVFVGGVSYTKGSKAIDAASQLTGECGGVFSMVRKHYVPEDGKTVDVMMYINFDTRKISISSTAVNIPVGYDGQNAANQVTYTTNAPMLDAGFIVTTGSIPKSFKIVPNAGVRLPEIIIMPINSGNTILIQAKDDNIVGICQKI